MNQEQQKDYYHQMVVKHYLCLVLDLDVVDFYVEGHMGTNESGMGRVMVQLLLIRLETLFLHLQLLPQEVFDLMLRKVGRMAQLKLFKEYKHQSILNIAHDL